MPIRINLLAEEQKAKLAKKRDPVLLTLRLAILWIVVLAVFSVILYAREASLRQQLAGLKIQWTQSEKRFAADNEEIKALQRVVGRAQTVKAEIDSRFLWAPQLEIYKDVVPPSVQITRFVGRRQVVTAAPTTGRYKALSSTAAEQVNVTLEGIAEGGRPELTVQDFLGKLKSNQRLASQVDDVRLVSLSKGNPVSVKNDPEAGYDASTARFVVEIQYRQRPLSRG